MMDDKRLMDKLSSRELRYIFQMTKLIHKDRYSAKILAATTNKALTPQEISSKCNIPLAKCFAIMKMLRENGLIVPAKKIVSENDPNKVDFLYEAKLDPRYIRFENGRFIVKFPEILYLSNGTEIDLKSFLKSYLT